MSPRRALGLGLALGALVPFAAIGVVGGALLALTQSPFAEAFGVTRWMVHPWLSLAGAAAALWPLSAAVTAALLLALRASGLRPWISAALAGALAWAGLSLGLTLRDAGGLGGPGAASQGMDWAMMLAPVVLLAAASLDLGPRLVLRLAGRRLDGAAEGGYPAAANRGRMP